MPPGVRGCVVSFGKFDALHRGHAAVFQKVAQRARELRAPAVVFTFDPAPAQILRPERAPRPLYTLEQKIELFEKFELDALVLFHTTREFLNLTARDFFQEIVLNALAARAIVEGDNFNFGRGKEGNDRLLESLCREANVQFEVANLVEDEEKCVSSTRIRELIAVGDVERAASLLARPFAVRGIVVGGDQRGRTFGIRTANVDKIKTIIPGKGVYACAAKTEDGKRFPAAVNLGENPTFGVEEMKFEAHLLDFQGDIYDQELEVTFYKKLRDVVRFESTEKLVEQIQRDIALTRDVFTRVL